MVADATLNEPVTSRLPAVRIPDTLAPPIISSSDVGLSKPIPILENVEIPTNVETPDTFKLVTEALLPANLFAVTIPVKLPSPTTSKATLGVALPIPIFFEV